MPTAVQPREREEKRENEVCSVSTDLEHYFFRYLGGACLTFGCGSCVTKDYKYLLDVCVCTC